ncbi:MAG: hypothetical protein BJ554DRAFT_7189 [Olpidium bornovanus]|uniref:Uncharacterized protein n=1 Tax=Olpidium bornovanus TaxID=278681 RepID=A0A8H7ZWG3_9FUNG|nr:MAG: hypothetical protein BJ554DRAFT_7189 [Olpidium bornovanus]
MSEISLFVTLTSLWMMGIYGRNKILAVPLVVGVAGCIANGLCYYAYYALYPLANQRTAAAVADIGWLVQECGLSFYSFQILRSILTGKKRIIYFATFGTFCGLTVLARILILAFRQKGFEGMDVQATVNAFHMVYFLAIACMEVANAWFLMNKLGANSAVSSQSAVRETLIASSELRMASLCLIGIMRAVTYYFQSAAQAASNVAGELDRFVAGLENLFPFVMLVSPPLRRPAPSPHPGLPPAFCV